MSTTTEQPLLRRTLTRVDDAWADFSDRVHAIPIQQLEVPVADGGWTRKQMLGHITTWHELTAARLSRFRETGRPAELPEEANAINVRAARGADGRTTGEILYSNEDSFRRLRREIARLDDDQLAAHDGWAASIIAGNTIEHYEEHLPDLATR